MTNRAAAGRYARALVDVAVAEKADLRALDEQLREYVTLLESNPALEAVLLNPAVPAPRKAAVVREIAERSGTQAVLAKLLALLAERDRFVLLPDVADLYRDRMQDHLKIVRAEVTTAVPLGADRAKAVEQGLSRVTGRTVSLSTRVDPSIIGGVVARLGSTVYDGSITRQLEKVKQRLIEGGQQ